MRNPITRLLAEDPRSRTVINVSRRRFLTQVGLAAGGLVLGVSACSDSGDDASGDPADGGPSLDGGVEAPPANYTDVDTFVAVGDDGSVRLVVHRSEMGQGVRTSCAMLIAEELCCDFEDVRVVQADGDVKYGDQNTDASQSVRLAWDVLRRAGAAAREMLLAAAAARLGVPVTELRAESATVIHDATETTLTYSDLAADAATQDVPTDPPLKGRADFRIIGQRQTGVDVRDIVQGRAVFGADVVVDGMRYASIERSPTRDGTVASFDTDAALAVPGVLQVVEIEAVDPMTNNGVAVIAENTSAALRGRAALNAQWTPAGTLEQSAAHRTMIRDTALSAGTPVLQVGDLAAALAAADRVVEAEYEGPYLAHAPMEPLVAVADVRADSAEVWAPTQDPQRVRVTVAALTGLDEAAVTVHVTLLGGGFGRKSQPDFIVEAVKLSQSVGAPVKLQWSREDEIRHGFYRPQTCQRLRATIDASNQVTGLGGHSVFSSFVSVFARDALGPLPAELDQGWANLPFAVDNLALETSGVPSGVRIGWWRSVCNTFHAFSVCSFLDEIAQAVGSDGVAIYRTLLGTPRQFEAMGGAYTFDTGRLVGVVDAVAQMGLWGSAVPAGEGIGFAAHMSFRSYVACAVHVAVDSANKITIKQVDYAIDCGTVVNPDGVEAQVEGGMVYGLTAALFGEIEVVDGAVVQSNFDDYEMLRIHQMPPVNVHIVDSTEPPTGAGEPPTPPIAPALTNAIFAATGQRIRALPVSRSGFTI